MILLWCEFFSNKKFAFRISTGPHTQYKHSLQNEEKNFENHIVLDLIFVAYLPLF